MDPFSLIVIVIFVIVVGYLTVEDIGKRRIQRRELETQARELERTNLQLRIRELEEQNQQLQFGVDKDWDSQFKRLANNDDNISNATQR